MNRLYQRKTGGGVEPVDHESPFPDIDADFAIDPFEEISEDIVSIMQGMAVLHRANFWLMLVLILSIAMNVFLFSKLGISVW